MLTAHLHPSRFALGALLALAAGCSSKSGTATLDGGPFLPDRGKGCNGDLATCVDALAPAWQLEDVQPKSARKGQVYGMEAFRGRVTVLALLAGG